MEQDPKEAMTLGQAAYYLRISPETLYAILARKQDSWCCIQVREPLEV